MKAQRLGILMVVCLWLVPVTAWAQAATSGGIAGVVKDPTGAVLPGVTVEASSPALIEKVRSVVSDAEGQYKIVDLRPGTYTVTFTLTGFSPVRREGVELTTAFTATVNGELRVGSVEETITVTGASPVVDVQNVRQQNVLSREILDTLPNGKGTQNFGSLIPGAILPATAQDVGGNKGEIATSFGIHGARAGDLKLLMDGMRFNAMQQGGGGSSRLFMVNQASVQEVVLETSGMSAESETGGVQLNFVPKEGGNDLRGSFVTNGTGRKLQNGNLSDTLIDRGLTTQTYVKQVFDVSLGLGGRIKRDKLWFFTAHRWWGAQEFVPGNYFNKTQQSWVYTPDLSRAAYTDMPNRDHNLRLTWQAAPAHKVGFLYDEQHNCNCFSGLNGNNAPEAVGAHYYDNHLYQGTWSHPATNRLLFEAGATVLDMLLTQDRQPDSSPEDISVLEQSTNYRYRSRATGFDNNYGTSPQIQANQRFSVSYITGSHALKIGMQLQEGHRVSTQEINQDTSYTFLRGLPQSVTLWSSHREENWLWPNLGIFGQDQWTMGKVTLNMGLRFDYLNAYNPAQHVPAGRYVPARDFPEVRDVPNWKDVSPRLGAAYDVFGDGTTAIKGSLGRYLATEASNFARANNPVLASTTNANRTWADANLDFIPQEEELGPLSDANFGKPKIVTRYAEDIRIGFGKRAYNWQGSVSIQRQLAPGIALNVGYFRTWYGNFQVTDNLAVTPADFDPYCITAPLDARLPGGGGNQICGLYDVKPEKFGLVDQLVTKASYYGKQTDVFNGIDVTFNARFSEGRQLAGGLSTGRQVTDNCYTGSDVSLLAEGQLVTAPRTTAFCHVSPPWSAGTQVKFSGIYPLPWDFQSSATVQNLPGIPYLASYVATNAEIAPSLGRNLAAGARGTATIDLIPPGTAYEDRITQMDFRLSRTFTFGRARAQGMFDIYNLFNSSPILSANGRYGSAWLVPTQILAGRLFKFGAQIDF